MTFWICIYLLFGVCYALELWIDRGGTFMGELAIATEIMGSRRAGFGLFMCLLAITVLLWPYGFVRRLFP